MNHSHRDEEVCACCAFLRAHCAWSHLVALAAYPGCGVVSHFLISPYAGPDRFRMRALDLQARIMRNLARRHVQHICPAQTVGHQAVPHATYPMDDPTSYKRALSGQPEERKNLVEYMKGGEVRAM